MRLSTLFEVSLVNLFCSTVHGRNRRSAAAAISAFATVVTEICSAPSVCLYVHISLKITMTIDFSKNVAITAKKVTFSIFDEFYTDKVLRDYL